MNITINGGIGQVNRINAQQVTLNYTNAPQPAASGDPLQQLPADKREPVRQLLDRLVACGELLEGYKPNQQSVPQLAVICAQLFARTGMKENNWQFAGALFDVAPTRLCRAYSERTDSPKMREYNRRIEQLFEPHNK